MKVARDKCLVNAAGWPYIEARTGCGEHPAERVGTRIRPTCLEAGNRRLRDARAAGELVLCQSSAETGAAYEQRSRHLLALL